MFAAVGLRVLVLRVVGLGFWAVEFPVSRFRSQSCRYAVLDVHGCRLQVWIFAIEFRALKFRSVVVDLVF